MSDKREPKDEKEAFAMALCDFLRSEQGAGLAQYALDADEQRQRMGLSWEQWEEVRLAGAEDLQRYRIRDNRRNASKPRKKQWAIDLAKELAGLGVSFPQAWRSIDEDGMKIYRGEGDDRKEYVYYSDPEEGDDKMERESFRTGYFSPAKRGKL